MGKMKMTPIKQNIFNKWIFREDSRSVLSKMPLFNMNTMNCLILIILNLYTRFDLFFNLNLAIGPVINYELCDTRYSAH